MVESSSGTFVGRLHASSDPDGGIAAGLTLVDGSVEIWNDHTLLGRWPLSDVSIEALSQGALRMSVEGEDWLFWPEQPEEIQRAVELTRNPPRATGSRWTVSADSLPSRSLLVSVLAATLGTASVFGLGFLIGRYDGSGSSVPGLYLLMLSAAAGGSWALIGLSVLQRPSRRGANSRTSTPSEALDSTPDDRLVAAVSRALEITLAAHSDTAVASPLETTTRHEGESVTGRTAETDRAGASAGGDRSTELVISEPIGSVEPAREEPSPSDDTPQTATLESGEADAPTSMDDITTGSDDTAKELLVEIERNAVPASTGEAMNAGEIESLASLRDTPVSLTSSGFHRVMELLDAEGTVPEPGLTEGGDDLELINGIGPVFADVLRALGYGTYQAVATLDEPSIDRVEDLVGAIRWRMERHRWKESAAELHAEKYGTSVASGAIE